jgi:hypothetical protein
MSAAADPASAALAGGAAEAVKSPMTIWQVVAVDLDLGAGMDEAGGRSPAGPGGDGDGQVGAAGDSGDLRGHLGGEGEPGGDGAGAVLGSGGVAPITALLPAGEGRGLDLAAEGERGDGLAEGLRQGVGDHVAVLGGRDPGQVGQGGIQPENLRDLGEASSSRSWGAQPVSPLACRVAKLRAAVMARESMPSDLARSKSVATSNWKVKRLDRASVRTAPCTPGLWPATT